MTHFVLGQLHVQSTTVYAKPYKEGDVMINGSSVERKKILVRARIYRSGKPELAVIGTENYVYGGLQQTYHEFVC